MSLILTSKWFLFGTVVAVVLVVLAVTGRKSVKAELFVSAPPEAVWRLITDASRYAAWNPLLVPKQGEIALGNKLTYTMTDNEGGRSEITARVKGFEANKYLNQFGGVPGVITFNHEYILKPLDGGTLITQQEEYRGVYVWLWDPEWLNGAYAKVNEAINNQLKQ